ncbi:receptor-like kinase [Rhynchospora pubera]|uniref:Receptor-like kinase n=1 Tax=Rhynchospora pubera TaxID=906938 RepID=A0AAV8CHQ1_9POAL|nr:receptor-like kinase [Rhynchospora pubera]
MASTDSNLEASSEYPSLYQTARIFTSLSYYSFQIQQHGHHFIRLHFYPFVYQNYDLANAKFNVSTQDIMLLTDFQLKNISSPIVKEYLVNITKDKLNVFFQPFSDLVFVNAIEVVSVPDTLIFDLASTINPIRQYTGLSTQALENVYRVNMGNLKVTPDNDTLWRTWVPDASFIQNQNFARWKSTIATINYMEGLVTAETAPPIVYSTATELALLNETTKGARFNITWQFDLQEGYTYMLRFHFFDIVSISANQLLFDVYVGPWAVLTDFGLPSLARPQFTDFILSAEDSTCKLNISIGPSKTADVPPDGILNGLEISNLTISPVVIMLGQELVWLLFLA